MEKIIEKVSDQLRPLLKKLLLIVIVDDRPIEDESNTLFGDKIKIYFSDDYLLEITTDDIPHFYGEGDLELKLENSEYLDEPFSKFREKAISEIKIYGWKKKGINLFGQAKYFVQTEFYHNDELLLSSGFFYFDESTEKIECLITGELSASCNKEISGFEKNLLVATIT